MVITQWKFLYEDWETSYLPLVVVHSLHDMCEINAYRVGHVSLSCFNLRTTGQILMKFDMGIITLEAIPNSY
jgi:hypothetical protein